MNFNMPESTSFCSRRDVKIVLILITLATVILLTLIPHFTRQNLKLANIIPAHARDSCESYEVMNNHESTVTISNWSFVHPLVINYRNNKGLSLSLKNLPSENVSFIVRSNVKEGNLREVVISNFKKDVDVHQTIKEETGTNTPQKETFYITHIFYDGRGLGNELFSYATLIGVARMNNMTVILNSTQELFECFHAKILRSSVNARLLANLSFATFGGPPIKYSSELSHLPKKHISLVGYLQSFRYFQFIKETIKEEFTFNENYTSTADAFLKAEVQRFNITDRKVIFIGIHVRRGDMLSDALQKYGFAVPKAEYFKHAMDWFKYKFAGSTLLFVVASNDLKWCKANLTGDYVTYTKENNKRQLDMAILTQCNHTIVSVGTFGWWAAWLAGGEVVYYKNWPTPNTTLATQTNVTEYFLPNWIGLS